jgi:phosphatidylserine decarboxylase
MRIPLTPHGQRELILLGGGSVAVGLLLSFLHPAAGVPFFLIALFVLSFFRDPERKAPDGAAAAVAPADGKVTDIETVDEPLVIKGPALRIGIFLSVFDVHVNRAPLDGTVTLVRYTEGAFLDARDPACKERNEANLVGFSGPFGPFAVRQVAGLIARRIVCPLQPGGVVVRGERIGMIKFGSRTELFVPAGAAVRVEAQVGQRVRGGETVLLRFEA